MEQVLLNPQKHALFLDFDGTLVDFAPTPDGIDVPNQLLALLEGLTSGFDGALALVTGRSVASLEKHLSGFKINIAGEHGAHFAFADGNTHHINGAGFATELAEANSLFAGVDGVEVEAKAAGFGIHYRRAPEQTEAVKRFMEEVGKARSDLEILQGNMIVEARSKGIHKGAAVERFLSTPSFAGRTPVFIGDDTTDEDGFRTVNQAGGISIKVGEGATVAQDRLADVEAVREWLAQLLVAFQSEEKV